MLVSQGEYQDTKGRPWLYLNSLSKAVGIYFPYFSATENNILFPSAALWMPTISCKVHCPGRLKYLMVHWNSPQYCKHSSC